MTAIPEPTEEDGLTDSCVMEVIEILSKQAEVQREE